MAKQHITAQKNITIKVGLTGGIGCGKSLVATLFQKKGIPVIDADRIAKDLVKPKQPALAEIVQHFGQDMLQTDGQLNRSALRNIVFNDKVKLEQLEAILHPRIKEIIQTKMAKYANNHPYIVADVPLLVEKNYQQLFDHIIVVDCLPEQQVSRVMARDKMTVQQIQAIISSQADRQQRFKVADEILDNTGSLDKLHQQVTKCHNKLCLLKPKSVNKR